MSSGQMQFLVLPELAVQLIAPQQTINEFHRVLKPEGIAFQNEIDRALPDQTYFTLLPQFLVTGVKG